MNIDARRNNTLRSSDDPFNDMVTGLEEFTDAVGGRAWRQHRARKVIFERALVLYLDEELESLARSADPETNKLHLDGPNDGEEIEVHFEASRERGEQPGDDFITTYSIAFTHALPLNSLDDIPASIRPDVEREMQDIQEEYADAAMLYTGDPKESSFSIAEQHTDTYIIDSEGTFSYAHNIRYIDDEFTVDGASYATEELDFDEVHPGNPNTSEEYGLQLGPLTEDEVQATARGSTEESVAVETEFISYLMRYEQNDSDAESLAITALPTEEHAIRVMALLSILKSGLYVPSVVSKENT